MDVMAYLTRMPRFEQTLSRVVAHVRTPLYANAYALTANQFVGAGIGFVYWLAAARLYSPEVVGQSAALISTVLFLASFSTLSLNAGMIRFLPRAGAGSIRLLVYTYATSLVFAAVIASLVLLLTTRTELALELLSNNTIWPGLLVLTTMVWCLLMVQDGALIGMRRSVYVLGENSLYALTKLLLLILGVTLFYENGILTSWFLPVPLFVGAVAILVFSRLLPAHVKDTQAYASGVTIRQVAASVSWDHVGSLFAEAVVRLLPLLVVELAGSSENAYFYQAWLIATTIYFVSSNMSSSFTVEASANLGQIALYSRRILLHMARLIVPAVLLIFIGAPLGLSLFGPAYAHESTPVLR